MAWRVARSLDTLLGQLNRAYPGRSIASDGSIGDAAHATRDSDHNPWYVLDGWGIVTARDYTNDPAHGFDAHALAERLRLSRDRRIKYVISNGRIFAGAAGPSPWTWRPYTGTSPHTKHIHLSVVASRLCDDTSLWSAVTAVAAAPIRNLDITVPSEEDPLAAFTEADLRKYVAEEVSKVLTASGTAGAGDHALLWGYLEPKVRQVVAEEAAKVSVTQGYAGAADVSAIVRALEPLLQPGAAVTTDQLTEALTRVLGSVDNPKE